MKFSKTKIAALTILGLFSISAITIPLVIVNLNKTSDNIMPPITNLQIKTDKTTLQINDNLKFATNLNDEVEWFLDNQSLGKSIVYTHTFNNAGTFIVKAHHNSGAKSAIKINVLDSNKDLTTIVNKLQNLPELEIDNKDINNASMLTNLLDKHIEITGNYTYKLKYVVTDVNKSLITYELIIIDKDNPTIQANQTFEMKYKTKAISLAERMINLANIKVKNNYSHLTAKKFYELEYSFGSNTSTNHYDYYLETNYDELSKHFTKQEMDKLDTFTFALDRLGYNRFMPDDVKIQLSIRTNEPTINDPSNTEQASKTITIHNFKKPPMGILDQQPITNLPTPQNAVSYKGKLEAFTFADITDTGEEAYKDTIKKMTWEDVKMDFMYQMRFALYQMFSDNFEEINYWIESENSTTQNSFTAVGEGIIKQDKNNFKVGFYYGGNTSSNLRTISVKQGDRVRVEVNFHANLGNWQPSLLGRGDILPGFTESWNWNFADNCENLLDKNDPLYKDDLPRINWTHSRQFYIAIKKNNNIIFDNNVSQYNSYSFMHLKRIPKSTRP